MPFQPCPFVKGPVCREEDLPGPDPVRLLDRRVEESRVTGTLVREDRHFRPPIIGESPVAVEMVFGYVEEDRDVRSETLYRLQLKAADLGDYVGRLLPARDVVDEGIADVSAHEDMLESRTEDPAEEGRCRCLAVRASDGDDRLFDKRRGELRLPNHPGAVPPGLFEQRMVRNNPGAHHNELMIEKVPPVMAAEAPFERNAVERLDRGRQFSRRLHVRKGDLFPEVSEKFHTRNPARPRTDDKNTVRNRQSGIANREFGTNAHTLCY